MLGPMVRRVGVGALVVSLEPQVRQFAIAENFGLKEFIDDKAELGERNMIFSPFGWLRLGNFGLCFESSD